MNPDIQKIFYNLLIRSELPGQRMSGEANMEAKTQVNLQGEVCGGHGTDPTIDTGYGGFTCSMNYNYSVCVIRLYENSDTDARGETPGQSMSGEAETKVNLQGVAYDGRGIDPITNTRWTQRIIMSHEM